MAGKRGHQGAVPPGSDPLWGRARLLLVLALAAVAVLGLLTGLGLAVKFAVDSAGSSGASEPPRPASAESVPVIPSGNPTTAAGEQARPDIAAASMLDAGPTGYRPAAPDTTPAEVIVVPPATAAGPVGVPTGFPRTPEGAVGQLAAIETTVLTAMDIRVANEVYVAWAEPGGVGGPDWELTRNVAAFLGSTGQDASLNPTVTVTATPAAGMVKGVDGPDWVVACVLLEVRATVRAEAAIGYGHCEAMTWDTGEQRWMIAPGAPAARAPSTWPGTEQARLAGWREWVPGS